MQRRAVRWLLVLLGIVICLAIAAIAGMHIAARTLKHDILGALGPQATVGDISVSFTRVVISDITVPAPKGWPSETTLKAPRVTVVPDLRQLIFRKVYISSINVENGYVSALRPKGGGGLQFVPSMTEKSVGKTGSSSKDNPHAVRVGEVNIDHCTVELFDASVPGKPVRLRTEDVVGTVKKLDFPELEERTDIDLKGQIKGPTHTGTITVTGWIQASSGDSDIHSAIHNADLKSYEGYFIDVAKGAVSGGTLNLTINSRIHDKNVHADGTLIISGLTLATPDKPLAAIAALPKKLIVKALEDDNDRIDIKFDLAGPLAHPKLQVDGNAAVRAGAAIANGTGLSFEGIIKAFAFVLGDVGSAFGQVFGKG